MPVIERIIKPKTHKGKQAILKREPKIIENAKQTFFIKGLKTTEVLQSCMKNLYILKKPYGQILQRRNDIRPFEDPTPLENFGRKFNASLFVLINNNKKRPNNLIIGRLFEHTIMDIVEFGVEDYKCLTNFKLEKISSDIKPMLVFQGELFESNHEYRRIKNLLIDMFQRETVKQIRLQGLEHVLSFTANDNCILFRSYKVLLKKSGTRVPRIELAEIGPRMNLRIRRTKLATDDLFKQACKKPKELKVKKKKNISEDNLGKTLGRVHVGTQKLNTIQTRKMKGLRKTLTERKSERKRKQVITEEDNAKKIKVNTDENNI
ncbi:PREDICTED: ribosome production factor 2 homolog [Ceratosolen solmsi marchali]|uniref:Ribosome production factor 2 homolog n=1 Tax=Ceratosolen solmsi marchali TaxID=326594 RepID=A0AAJ6YR07_9HYME|nr:PREDICTED: ribosome production factor 2 homolog [Ceratosolen solmsi marchali]